MNCTFDMIRDRAFHLWAEANGERPRNARWASKEELAPFFALARIDQRKEAGE